MIIFRYISINRTFNINKVEPRTYHGNFNYVDFSDKDTELSRMDTVKAKEFYILAAELLFESENKFLSIFKLQDDYASPVPPKTTMTFFLKQKLQS